MKTQTHKHKHTNKNKNNLPRLGRAYEEVNRIRANVPRENLLGLNIPIAARQNIPISPNLEGLFDFIGPFTKGIFLDNDQGHRFSVQNACRHAMTVIDVPETNYFRADLRIASPEYVEFVSNLSSEGKDAAKVLSRLCLVAGAGIESLDPVSGIHPAQVTEVNTWVEREAAIPGARLVAIFDFDRTISVMEGGFFLGNSIYDMKKLIVEQVGKQEDLARFVPGLTANGFAEYLAGGHERVAMLQEMFDSLYDHNVRIILLTNNGGCLRARNLFRELMMIYTRNRPVEVICGIEFGGNKGVAILGKPTNIGNLKSLRDMCMLRGGYRKTTRKAKNTKKTRHR